MARKTYTTKTPVQHDGKNFVEGDPIELDDKTEAPQLLAVDAIELAPAAKKTEAK